MHCLIESTQWNYDAGIRINPIWQVRELKFRGVMWFVQSGGTLTPSQVCLHPGPMFLTPVRGIWSCSPIPTVYKSLKCRENACYHCSVQFSSPVVSDSLRPHGQQHTRLPCLLPTPGACSNSCPSNQWCHPTDSSSVVPFSSCLQSFPASGSFPMSQFFAPAGQSIAASTSASVLPMNIQDWFLLGLTSLIFL